MINLKITMNNGEQYNIKNFSVNTIDEFIKIILCRNQTQLNWYEIIPNVLIQVKNIQSICKLSDEDILKLNMPSKLIAKTNQIKDISNTLKSGDEIIFDEDKPNSEIPEKIQQQSPEDEESDNSRHT